jgi:tRNA G18 (ribose-2'-O)-methylase SpoU
MRIPMSPRTERLVVVCDNIRSTHNVGSIFRTADGAGVDRIYLCGITPRPPRPDINKVSLGAETSVPFSYRADVVRLLMSLKKKGFTIIALENNIPGSVIYTKCAPQFPVALVVGSEVGGIGKAVLASTDHAVFIPMHGVKESLNVSVAFGIVAYALVSGRGR